MPSRPGPAADRDDPVAGSRPTSRTSPCGITPTVPQKTRGLARYGGMADEGAVDGGDAHPVAVVADPGDHAFQDPPGVQDAPGQGVARGVGRRHAEDVGVADRLGAQAGAHRVADHAAEPGVGPAVGVDRRGVVVGLDLEADVESRRRTGPRPRCRRRTLTNQSQPIAWVAPKMVCLSRLSITSAVELDLAPAGSCASNARSRSGPGSPARSRSARGRGSAKWASTARNSARLKWSWPALADREQFGVGLPRGSAPRPGRSGTTSPGRARVERQEGRPRPGRRRRWPGPARSAGASRPRAGPSRR